MTKRTLKALKPNARAAELRRQLAEARNERDAKTLAGLPARKLRSEIERLEAELSAIEA